METELLCAIPFEYPMNEIRCCVGLIIEDHNYPSVAKEHNHDHIYESFVKRLRTDPRRRIGSGLKSADQEEYGEQDDCDRAQSYLDIYLCSRLSRIKSSI